MTKKIVLVNLSVEPETKELLEHLAKSSKRSVDELLRSYIEPYLEEEQQKDMAAMYRRESNAIQLFIDEICEIRQGAIASSSSIYQQYKHWCGQNTYRPKSIKNFKGEMERLGFYAVRRAQGIYYNGIEVKNDRR